MCPYRTTQITFVRVTDGLIRVPILYIENYILRVSNIYVHLRRTILESCDDSHKKDCTEQRVKKGEKKHERKKEIQQQRKEVHLFG